jgi:cytochrome P450
MSESSAVRATPEWPFDARAEPNGYFAELRGKGEIQRVPGTDTFIAGRWEDVAAIAQNHKVFIQDLTPVQPEFRKTVTPCPFHEAPPGKYEPLPAPFSDGDDHKVKRRWGLTMVQPERLRGYEPFLRALCDELIDAFVEQGRCEFRTDFAIPLPSQVVGTLLGVPKEETEQFVHWVDDIFTAGLLGAPEEHKLAAERAWREMYDYVSDNVIDRFKHPKDDFLSELIRVQVEQDGGLDLNFQIVQASNFIQAGSETTVNMLCNAMAYVARDAALRDSLIADPEQIPAMIEETLRLEAPVSVNFRLCTEDTEVNGVAIPEGALVMILWSAGNLDEERFECPAEFRLGRPRAKNDTLSFGRGSHRCIGAPLARLEGKIAYERLLTRLPNLHLVESESDLTNVESSRMHGPRKLTLAFDRP